LRIIDRWRKGVHSSWTKSTGT